ncbi:MAG: D-amino acid dehydrogenase [Hydrogenophaga sp.]|uniref:D-amino acid dehydrogenase n=1 Tax=Hydrogenophaga sp. TaxID=1904254 RepID=UPI002626592A|nr:D-amino acid dehydrogenase [Hydrogenophaga sp.]MDM7941712.1 D-amino acid dehydrogenase [Hydrogenophaga sp.]
MQQRRPTSLHVCVLGAGIVGLATAWQLVQDGHSVTVVDSAQAGTGASAANGAQLSYAYVQPLADPGIWSQLPKLLLARDSPLKLRPQMDPQQWAWGLRFMAACRASVSAGTTASLLALAAESRAGFDHLLAREDIDCDFSTTGKLVLYPDAASFAGARRQLALQRSLGSVQHALSPAEAVAVEPALAGYAAQMAGAIHTPDECAADCFKVCRELQRLLQARGVRFVFDTPVTRLVRRSGRIDSVETPAGPIEADAFVVALGAGSQQLARPLGLHVPVVPLKGYSITLPATAAAPRVSVTDVARKVVFARLGERLRVAGMAELVGHDRRIDPERIRSLLGSVREVFGEIAPATGVQPWAGLRPATPTGLPVLGRLRGSPVNLFFNTGHGALGFTLAFGSARRVARELGASLRPAAAALAACSA